VKGANVLVDMTHGIAKLTDFDGATRLSVRTEQTEAHEVHRGAYHRPADALCSFVRRSRC